MCKHVINAQIYMLTVCCNKWYECSECHDNDLNDSNFHIFEVGRPLRCCCKKCNLVFQVNLQYFSENDKFCSSCGNCWCLAGYLSLLLLLLSFCYNYNNILIIIIKTVILLLYLFIYY